MEKNEYLASIVRSEFNSDTRDMEHINKRINECIEKGWFVNKAKRYWNKRKKNCQNKIDIGNELLLEFNQR